MSTLNEATVSKMTDSLHNMWSMLVEGTKYIAISAAAPFSNWIILHQTTHLWVVVLGIPDLVKPLLERYLSLSWDGITTEGIDVGSAHPQPDCDCAEQSPSICNELRRAMGCGLGLPYLYPLSLLGSTSLSSLMASLTPQVPLDFPRATPVGLHFPPLGLFSLKNL